MLLLFTLKIYSDDNVPEITYFVDCKDCDLLFIRQELGFVSFVRDAKIADIHVLITESNTGSGGVKYFVNFIGQNDFKGINDQYIVAANQSDSLF